MAIEKTITARARASGKMTRDDLRGFLAELDNAGAGWDVPVKVRVSFGGWLKEIRATVKDASGDG